MVKLYLTSDNVFMLNLSSNVGRGQPNKIDDVELVRYAYFCKAFALKRFPVAATLPLITLINGMNTRGPYALDLQAVIDQDQSDLGGTTDGHVSTCTIPFASKNPPREQGRVFSIVSLNGFMVERDPASWPRIDQFVESGSTISKFVQDFFNSDFG